MRKGLGKIRHLKKKHIFLAILAVIVLGGLAKAYSAWIGTTRIAFLNYQAIALGQISNANDNGMIKLSEITTDDFDHLTDSRKRYGTPYRREPAQAVGGGFLQGAYLDPRRHQPCQQHRVGG